MTTFIKTDDPVASAAKTAIQAGDVEALKALLATQPDLPKAHIGDQLEARTLLHILTDWPGKTPNGPVIAITLISAGADVDAPFIGKHAETALHWAASNGDVAMLDVLLDSGAEINAKGGVIAETPLANARAFLEFETAHRLIERGANVTLHDAATMGLLPRVERACLLMKPSDRSVEINNAFWNACHGGQLVVAKFLYEQGADINAMPSWEELSPLRAARRSGADHVVVWLEAQGANG
ncbi:Hypothetical protein R9X50_00367200 [Acrodontium crateriforme]|uniref:Ankyrin n=1 Tax=Acrodontium crateriforme TaxID=150365 RepID=A0AAQ3M9J0_9PEZI|nr:Hypothetical protein R9X50_00367200 [Acrodontium crateriforme]